MDAADRPLWARFFEAHVEGANRPVTPAALAEFERRLAAQPTYLRRWLATATITDPKAVVALLVELGWLAGARTSAPLVDPEGRQQRVALDRVRRALELFRDPPLSEAEQAHFSARFATLGATTEPLLWQRTNDGTFLALACALGLLRRPPPTQESPLP